MYKKLKKIFEEKNFRIPLSIPEPQKNLYRENYLKATQSTGKLFLFAGDQKIEHLNKDFFYSETSSQLITPRHLFEIANKARIGAFAAQLGLISHYADDFRNVNYIVKMNSKTDLVPTELQDPLSAQLTTIEDVIEFKRISGLSIVGVGFTVYLGSMHEATMLEQASKLIFHAHQHGLITVLWMYPRGIAVKGERHEDIVAGAAGVAVCLGADFVKVNPPEAPNGLEQAKKLIQATSAAGPTGVICSGGQTKKPENFLEDLFHQIQIAKVRGAAIGRNVYQKKLEDAIRFCNAVAAIIIDNAPLEKAQKIWLGSKK
ncbi:MAG: aldolase [bacterium]